ncbi:hypothetical protein HRW16_10265 [Streptomyces lunaelactis]|uniref:hypothetical protein n=1 Tax=Streptomyces lunaelactis TaxID=1535768 RepID=UPI001584C1CD|nr:hypothetical protein [Streptomyces lunaelactis]NUK35291.1 hypothetical protein [Streptomyces lunaelactis]NUK41877.1 hypothetical protein [Streptomyces lunaelactis]NUK56904.1 hypothetical protein [Streptomyces lunaelactis]NUK92227.1 hypothetical protein [Streptomyces lunaelactis]NUL11486.1 hypothetical protein [Streptomyces lunaelactis]
MADWRRQRRCRGERGHQQLRRPQESIQHRTHIPHLAHAGQLEGLVIAVDDFSDFATHVQELVWTAP